jgi:hypothetical protein
MGGNIPGDDRPLPGIVSVHPKGYLLDLTGSLPAVGNYTGILRKGKAISARTTEA